MDQITVKKDELLSVLKKNRESHRAIFLEAQEGYRKAVIAELDSMIGDAKSGRKIRRQVTLVEPVDQTKDYDRVIRMLEMSVDAEIKLHEHEFQAYVLDEWNWKNQFNVSNVGYSQTLSAMLK